MTLRRTYLRLWREDPDGDDWSLINANMKFATFNVILCCVMVAFAIITKLACEIL